jgi:thioredoxin reductase
MLIGQPVSRLRREDPYRIVTLADGKEVSGHALVLATGMAVRELAVPGVPELIGAGIYYGAALSEASLYRGKDVAIVGGANSAGQGALFFSRYARSVTMLVRAPALSPAMARYLVDRIAATENIRVCAGVELTEARGEGHLEQIGLREVGNGETRRLDMAALFVFIGVAPHTEAFAGFVERDEKGFILPGPDLPRRKVAWPLERDPLMFETSVPGVSPRAKWSGSNCPRWRWARARRRSTPSTATCRRSDSLRTDEPHAPHHVCLSELDHVNPRRERRGLAQRDDVPPGAQPGEIAGRDPPPREVEHVERGAPCVGECHSERDRSGRGIGARRLERELEIARHHDPRLPARAREGAVAPLEAVAVARPRGDGRVVVCDVAGAVGGDLGQERQPASTLRPSVARSAGPSAENQRSATRAGRRCTHRPAARHRPSVMLARVDPRWSCASRPTPRSPEPRADDRGRLPDRSGGTRPRSSLAPRCHRPRSAARRVPAHGGSGSIPKQA